MDGEVKRDHGLGVWINAEHKRRCGSRRILSKDLELCFLLVIFLPVLGHTNLRNGLYLEKSATHKANVVVEIKRIVLIMDSINTGNETNNASWSVTWPLVFEFHPNNNSMSKFTAIAHVRVDILEHAERFSRSFYTTPLNRVIFYMEICTLPKERIRASVLGC